MSNPWCTEKSECNINQLGQSAELQADSLTTFEDNFVPPIQFTALDDSEQYLATLENRLRRLRTDTNILSQLQSRREACMEYLLNSDEILRTDSDIELEASPAGEFGGAIIRHIRPEQPLNLGEVVHIIKYDQLDESAQSNTEDASDHSDSGASR